MPPQSGGLVGWMLSMVLQDGRARGYLVLYPILLYEYVAICSMMIRIAYS